MTLSESILCSTFSPSPNSGSGSIALHDIQTGTTLATFKQTNAQVHGTAVAQSKYGYGGFMLTAQHDKPIMNVYNFQKDQIASKTVVPEKLSCVAVDSQGRYCAGGSAQGRIFIWEVASGILYNTWDAHYRRVSVLRFNNDGSMLFSGSEDSGVYVWSVSRLLDDAVQDVLPAPYCMLSDHTLPVTDIACGFGPFPLCRILTSSVDHSVKLWDLQSKTLLTSWQFPKPISSLAWEPTERVFFAASPDGSVHQVNLFRQRDDGTPEAVGGGGVSDIIHIGLDDMSPTMTRKRLIIAGHPISSMTISLTSSILLVGTTDGLILLYDIASHQLIRTISTHNGFAITSLYTMLRPPDLVGHVTLGMGASTVEQIPVRTVAPFHRTKDLRAREAHEVNIVLPPQENTPYYDFTEYSTEEMMRDHTYFFPPEGSESMTSERAGARVTELEAEVSALKEKLAQAKGINDAMWEKIVHKVAADLTVTGKGVEGAEEEEVEEPKRKKTRT